MTILTQDLEAAAASGVFQPLTTERFLSRRVLLKRYLGWTDAEIDETERRWAAEKEAVVNPPQRMACQLSWTEEEILECERLWEEEKAAEKAKREANSATGRIHLIAGLSGGVVLPGVRQ